MISIKDFTKLYLDTLLLRFSEIEFEILDDRTITAEFVNKKVIIAVEKAYNEYVLKHSELTQILDTYTKIAVELFDQNSTININRIVPIMKPIEFIPEISTEIYQMYNDELIIIYAEDKFDSIRYLTINDLENLSLNLSAINILAVKNLDKLLTSIKRKQGEGVYMLVADGNYEASIILLNEFLTKENFPIEGDLVISIPNKDILLISGSDNQVGLLRLKEITENIFQSGNYSLSNHLYKWNGKKFKKYID